MFYSLGRYDWGLIAERVRTALVGLLSFLAAYLSPVAPAFITLFVLWVANNIVGVVCVVGIRQVERFRLKKSFSSLMELIAYFIILILTKAVIYDFGEHDLFAMVVKYLTWLISYWYLVNILRNINLAAPRYKAISFLYKLVSFKGLGILLRRFGMTEKDIQELTADEEEGKDEEGKDSKRWDRGESDPDGGESRATGSDRRVR